MDIKSFRNSRFLSLSLFIYIYFLNAEQHKTEVNSCVYLEEREKDFYYSHAHTHAYVYVEYILCNFAFIK